MHAGLRAAVIIAFALWMLYPGWYSFDSAALLAQARTGQYMNLQPPMNAALWALLLHAGLPPGAMMALNFIVIGASLALLASAAAPSARGVTWALPLLPLWPPVLVLFGHLWTDVTFCAVLLLCAACAAQAQARGSRAWAAAAIAAALFSASLRHNAIFALPPLVWWIVSTWPVSSSAPAVTSRLNRAPLVHAQRDAPVRRRSVLVPVVVVMVAAVAMAIVCDRWLTTHRTTTWTLTAVWDLGAVSVATNELLIPDRMHAPSLTVDALRDEINPDASFGLSAKTPIDAGILAPLPPEVLSEVRTRWLSLPFTEPSAYFAHRFAIAWSLFGPQRVGKIQELHIAPGVVVLSGNPVIVANDTALNRAFVREVRAARHGWLFAPLTSMLPGLLAVLLAWRTMPSPARSGVFALVASGWFYAATLIPMLPGAEVRYTLWAMVANLAAFLIAVPLALTSRSEPALSNKPGGKPPPFTAAQDL
jgi:hypothetical protein